MADENEVEVLPQGGVDVRKGRGGGGRWRQTRQGRRERMGLRDGVEVESAVEGKVEIDGRGKQRWERRVGGTEWEA